MGTDIMETTRPTCFISYSHDSETHKTWVRGLAEHLQTAGVLTRLDQWDLTLGMDANQYMEESIYDSDYVLMVCTPGYAESANGSKGGVGWEKQIITGEMFDRISSKSKFVPILRHQDRIVAIPRFLKGKYFANFSKDDDFLTSIEELLRHFYNAPRYVRPPLGTAPVFTNDGTLAQNRKMSSSAILPEIFELSDIADIWERTQRPYHHVENLSNGLCGLIRHPPANVVTTEEPLRSFLLLAALHNGGNWLYWVGANLNSPLAVATILTALGVSYERVRFRAYYALQFFDPEMIRQGLVKTHVRISESDIKIIEQYVLNGNVKAYLLETAGFVENRLAEKVRTVIREIEQFGPDPASNTHL